MSSLESADEDEDGTDVVRITAGDQEFRVELPADASQSEAAAIASAVGAHLSDQQRAAATAAAAATESTTEYANEWVLEGRLSRFGKRRRPRSVEKGDEWKAAGRSFYR